MKIFLTILCVCFISTTSLAEVYNFGGFNSGSWHEADNWWDVAADAPATLLPGAITDCYLEGSMWNDAVFGLPVCMRERVGQVHIGGNFDPNYPSPTVTMEMKKGVLRATTFSVGYGWDQLGSIGVLQMDGGYIWISNGQLNVGKYDTGTVNINDGEIVGEWGIDLGNGQETQITGGPNIDQALHGIGTINLNGGYIEGQHLWIWPGSKIVIKDGLLYINAFYLATDENVQRINEYIADGRIEAADGWVLQTELMDKGGAEDPVLYGMKIWAERVEQDLDKSGMVDFDDLLLFASEWLSVN